MNVEIESTTRLPLYQTTTMIVQQQHHGNRPVISPDEHSVSSPTTREFQHLRHEDEDCFPPPLENRIHESGYYCGSSAPRHFNNKDRPTLLRSKSIPIRDVIKRTPSELQLREEEEVADFRDYLMFTRIVDGMTKRQADSQDCRSRLVNDMTLAHIIGTRNLSEDELKLEAKLHHRTDGSTVGIVPDHHRHHNRHHHQQHPGTQQQMPTRTSIEPTSLKHFLESSYDDFERDEDMFREDEMFLLEM